ncbi:type II secretion system F family protein [Streptomyces capparidis]
MNQVTAAALVGLAGAAAWTLSGHDETLRRARRLTGAAGQVVGAPPPGPLGGGLLPRRWAERAGAPRELLALVRARWAREGLCVGLGVLAAVLLRSPAPALAGLAAVPVVRRLLRRRAAERLAAARRSAVIELCSCVAGELRSGRPPLHALAQAVADGGLREDPAARTGVLAAARFGGDVPGALRRAAAAPGAEGLAGMAACWEVAVDSGGGLAEGLERVTAALRAEERQREDLKAQLAGPRSTAVLLALLPAAGVLLGTALGADPLRVLLHTPAGLACLVLGAALEWAGFAWTARIVRGAS